MLDFCAEKGIVADIEMVRAQEIDAAYERMQKSDVKYRFVIDMPDKLTAEQKAAVEQLSKVMNGNPRERILRAAGAR